MKLFGLVHLGIAVAARASRPFANLRDILDLGKKFSRNQPTAKDWAAAKAYWAEKFDSGANIKELKNFIARQPEQGQKFRGMRPAKFNAAKLRRRPSKFFNKY